MKVDINKYSVLKNSLKTITEVSCDASNDCSLVVSSNEIVSYDDVVKLILKVQGKSCDGFWDFKSTGATFIEFKNGAFTVENILLKYKYSVDVLNNNILKQNNNINDFSFILVYNESFVIKKDHASLDHLSKHILMKSSISKQVYYSGKIKEINSKISNSICFKSNEFLDFISKYY